MRIYNYLFVPSEAREIMECGKVIALRNTQEIEDTIKEINEKIGKNLKFKKVQIISDKKIENFIVVSNRIKATLKYRNIFQCSVCKRWEYGKKLTMLEDGETGKEKLVCKKCYPTKTFISALSGKRFVGEPVLVHTEDGILDWSKKEVEEYAIECQVCNKFTDIHALAKSKDGKLICPDCKCTEELEKIEEEKKKEGQNANM